LIPDLEAEVAVKDSLVSTDPVRSDDLRDRILRIHRQALRAHNLELANYLGKLAWYYKGQEPRERKLLEEQLEIQERVLGRDARELVGALVNRAEARRAEAKAQEDPQIRKNMEAEADALVARIGVITGKTEARLRKGVSGPEVKSLQEKLSTLGFRLSADGI